MSEVEWLLQAAQEFGPASDPQKAGELRLYLRDNFDAVMKVKDDRKLSWGQVASILAKRGLTKKNGNPLDANIVAVTAAAVRLERNPRSRKGRLPAPAKAGQEAEAQTASGALPRPAAPGPAASPSSPTPLPASNKPANPYAELERRQEEAKQRRERVAKSRDWNPFDLSKKESPE